MFSCRNDRNEGIYRLWDGVARSGMCCFIAGVFKSNAREVLDKGDTAGGDLRVAIGCPQFPFQTNGNRLLKSLLICIMSK